MPRAKAACLLLLVILGWYGTPAAFAAPDTIGPEALVELPTSGLHSALVNYRPGHGETVTVNPPRFSWTYNPEPVFDRKPGFFSWDISPKEFIFQVAYSAEALLAARELADPLDASLVVNLRTKSNSFNLLPPFRPPNGTEKVFWQVGYLKPKDPEAGQPLHQFWTLKREDYESRPYVWSAVRHFAVAPTAEVWDRSMFSDDPRINTQHVGYLASRAQHPYLLFNAKPALGMPGITTREALFRYLNQLENDYIVARTRPLDELYAYGRGWNYAKSGAAATLTEAWWPSEKPCPATSNCGGWADKIAEVAFVYQMVKEHPEVSSPAASGTALVDAIVRAQPGRALVRLAQYYLEDSGPGKDQIVDQEHINIRRALAFGYDWLYDILSDAERQEVRRALELTCLATVKGGVFYSWGWSAKADPLGEYAGSYFTATKGGSVFFRAAPHPIDMFHSEMLHAVAAYQDSAACREAFDLGLNYMFGVTYPWGMGGAQNSGRTYYLNTNAQPLLDIHSILQMSMPEGGFSKNPYWRANEEFVSQTFPPGFVEAHGAWGVTSGNAFRSIGDELAYFVGSGRLFRQWREETLLTVGRYSDQPLSVRNLPIPFHFKPKMSQEVSSTTASRAFLQDGWVTGCAYPSDDRRCYGSGIGFVLQGRPSGVVPSTYNLNSDLSFQLWAYGSTITDAGAYGVTSVLGHSNLSHNTLFVDGQGTSMEPNPNPLEPYFARVFAFKQNSTGVPYVYAAVDGTRAFPHRPYAYAGKSYPGLTGLSKVHRHLLMVRNRYFVLLDELESSVPARFSWQYRLLEDRVSFSGASFSYESNVKKALSSNPSTVTAPDVHVQVHHLFRAAELEVLDRTGLDVGINPFTGEAATNDLVADAHPTSHAIWATNRTPQTSWRFLTVIYPEDPQDKIAGRPAPVVERLDDETVKVTHGDATVDIVSFNSVSASARGATLVVDLETLKPRPVPDGAYGVGPAVIASAPRSREAAVGQSVTLSVTATGAPPLRYQWQRNGVDIRDALSASYSTPALQLVDDGAEYRCVVSNALGTVTSAAAVISVRPMPGAPSSLRVQ